MPNVLSWATPVTPRDNTLTLGAHPRVCTRTATPGEGGRAPGKQTLAGPVHRHDPHRPRRDPHRPRRVSTRLPKPSGPGGSRRSQAVGRRAKSPSVDSVREQEWQATRLSLKHLKHPQNRPHVTSGFRKQQLAFGKRFREEFCRCEPEFVEQLTGEQLPRKGVCDPRSRAGQQRWEPASMPRASAAASGPGPSHTFPTAQPAAPPGAATRKPGPRQAGTLDGAALPSRAPRSLWCSTPPAPLPGAPPSQASAQRLLFNPKPETPFQLNTKEDVLCREGDPAA